MRSDRHVNRVVTAQLEQGRVLTCGVFQTIAALEVRCGYSDDDLIRSQIARELETAREIAAGWKATAELKGFR